MTTPFLRSMAMGIDMGAAAIDSYERRKDREALKELNELWAEAMSANPTDENMGYKQWGKKSPGAFRGVSPFEIGPGLEGESWRLADYLQDDSPAPSLEPTAADLGFSGVQDSARSEFSAGQSPDAPEMSFGGAIPEGAGRPQRNVAHENLGRPPGGEQEALAMGIIESAEAAGTDPLELGTAISYETGGTFDPRQAGPNTKWGQHRGLIQFGEPQAEQYGVDWDRPLESQLGQDGAVVNYLRDSGFEPGMDMYDLYSSINAGAPGRHGARDAAAGGAPGTVRDKVDNQMGEHRARAAALLEPYYRRRQQRGQNQYPTGTAIPES